MLTLILLPGMDGTGLLFEPFTRALGAAAKVQVIDYPQDQPMGYAELQRYVKAALPDNAPFVLLAESFAGPIGIQIAAEENPLLQGVILCCTFARNPRPGLDWSRWLIGLMPVSRMPRFVMNHVLLGRFATSSLRTAIAGAVARVAPAVMRARLRAVMSVDVSEQAARMRVPCLYLRAKHDRLVPRDAFEHIRLSAPGMRSSTIDGPHCLLQAAPQDAARVVTAFLHELETDYFKRRLG
jgi:pimeloyl-ACP methyl ester carboxylesterase